VKPVYATAPAAGGIRQGEFEHMLGWMIVFALMAVMGFLSMLMGTAAVLPAKTVGLLFTTLFVLSLLTLAARRRA
jgi:hypothetical protein